MKTWQVQARRGMAQPRRHGPAGHGSGRRDLAGRAGRGWAWLGLAGQVPTCPGGAPQARIGKMRTARIAASRLGRRGAAAHVATGPGVARAGSDGTEWPAGMVACQVRTGPRRAPQVGPGVSGPAWATMARHRSQGSARHGTTRKARIGLAGNVRHGNGVKNYSESTRSRDRKLSERKLT